MTPPGTTLSAERRALRVGVAAAPALALLGVGIGLVEGGLLPGACEGLACLFGTLVLATTAVVAVVWLLVWGMVRLHRRHHASSSRRLALLRVLAGLSWGPVAWLLVVALGG